MVPECDVPLSERDSAFVLPPERGGWGVFSHLQEEEVGNDYKVRHHAVSQDWGSSINLGDPVDCGAGERLLWLGAQILPFPSSDHVREGCIQEGLSQSAALRLPSPRLSRNLATSRSIVLSSKGHEQLALFQVVGFSL
jgi:hypothetical protein